MLNPEALALSRGLGLWAEMVPPLGFAPDRIELYLVFDSNALSSGCRTVSMS